MHGELKPDDWPLGCHRISASALDVDFTSCHGQSMGKLPIFGRGPRRLGFVMANTRIPNDGVPCFDNGTCGIIYILPRTAKVCVLSWEERGDWGTDGRKGSEFLAGWSYCIPRYSDPVVQRTSSALNILMECAALWAKNLPFETATATQSLWWMEFNSAMQLHWLWNAMNDMWYFYILLMLDAD